MRLIHATALTRCQDAPLSAAESPRRSGRPAAPVAVVVDLAVSSAWQLRWQPAENCTVENRGGADIGASNLPSTAFPSPRQCLYVPAFWWRLLGKPWGSPMRVS